MSGIAFALNYPTEFELVKYNAYDCKYRVRYLEGIGWHTIDLDEVFVRSCMTATGSKIWTAALAEPTSYEKIFGNRGIKI